MKKPLLFLIMICLLMTLTGCTDNCVLTNIVTGNNAINNGEVMEEPSSQPDKSRKPETEPESPVKEVESKMSNIEIIVGSKTFSATLYDNEAARTLIDMLPLTLNMSDLNGNEKYYYIDTDLPTIASRPSEIKTGDIMLYGNSCLVLFYENFLTSYNYTALGYISDPSGLAAALGSSNVQVTFKKG